MSKVGKGASRRRFSSDIAGSSGAIEVNLTADGANTTYGGGRTEFSTLRVVATASAIAFVAESAAPVLAEEAVRSMPLIPVRPASEETLID